MARKLSYSRWDGTQVGFEVDADDVMAQINDDLLYHGDINAALRKLLQEGFKDKMGNDVSGMRELLEKLRQRREEALENNNLGGVYDEIAQALRDLVEEERTAIQDMLDQAKQSGDERRTETAESAASMKNMQLDFLPQDLAGQVKELSSYDFQSAEAQQKFQDLMEQLKQQLMQQQLNQMSQNVSDMTPEDMAHMKDMYSSLNNLLDAKNKGEDTEQQFKEFMEKFGDFFPDNPETLDELLEQMAQQMAAAQQMLNSMTPEQRAQMQALSDQLLEDMDLRWQIDQLGKNLQQAFPQAGWQKSYDFQGGEGQGMGMGQAMSMMQELGNIDALENLLRNATSPGALNDVDFDIAKNLLGDDGAKSLEKLAELTKMLERAGLIEQKEGRLELTAKGMRRVGANALDELFSKLAKDKLGRHQMVRTGMGQERTYDTKPYEFGDPFNLSIEKTIRNAIARQGQGSPVRLTPEDFEIEQTETLVRASTVLMLDMSLSMPMRDNFLPAKKVAMALYSLISTQFPRDFLGLVGFSETAREIKPIDLPEVSWDFVYGTNMQHAFLLSRRMLAKQTGTKQIIMITDGEPTAHILPNGEPFFSYPPVRETIEATLTEVARCTREGITINTFMLDATSYLKNFVERITQMNKGRAFFTTTETLGDYVLVDFMDQKRSQSKKSGRR
jgi:uncharacterized protein with von Willebrand factor type A (vWA) domain